ncbi:MAG TPA: glycosyltransferase family 61 protein [Adhaeribacter sp.]|nr:glycosyltransferase family 61 protein [Adhaeribacter sp.]
MRFKKIAFRFLSAINYFNRHVSVYHQPGRQVLLPPELKTFSPDETKFLELAAASFNYEIDYSRGYRQKETWFAMLKDVSLLGNSGGVIMHGPGPDKLVTESVFDLRRLAGSPAWRIPAFMFPKRKKGVYAAIFHLPWAATSNYHWFFDCLPRLYALLENTKEPFTLVMPEFAPNFQRETLGFLLEKHPQITIETIRKTEKWRCETLLFSSFVAGHFSAYLPAPVAAFMRNGIKNGYKTENNIPEKRIYISRSKATKRRIKNEAELLPVLEKYGFEIVFPEYLTYRDQVQLFSDSRYIIGAHGAGLTNTFFAQKASVLELHPENVVKSHYFMLCYGLGFDYQYMVGGKPDAKLDFEVDVVEFERKVREILEEKKS